jgi:hypothetical protein
MGCASDSAHGIRSRSFATNSFLCSRGSGAALPRETYCASAIQVEPRPPPAYRTNTGRGYVFAPDIAIHKGTVRFREINPKIALADKSVSVSRGQDSARCQRITVSGWRIFKASRTPGTRRYSPGKHQAIDTLEHCSFGRFALQDVELMAQNKDFRLKPCPRPEYVVSAHASNLRKSIIGQRASPDSPSAR